MSNIVCRYIDATDLTQELFGKLADAGDSIELHVGDPDPVALGNLLRDAQIVLNGHTFLGATHLAAALRLRSIIFLGSRDDILAWVQEGERTGGKRDARLLKRIREVRAIVEFLVPLLDNVEGWIKPDPKESPRTSEEPHLDRRLLPEQPSDAARQVREELNRADDDGCPEPRESPGRDS
jgi:hypothetical protein